MTTHIHTPGIKLSTKDLKDLTDFINSKMERISSMRSDIITADVWFTKCETGQEFFDVKILIPLPGKQLFIEKKRNKGMQSGFLIAFQAMRLDVQSISKKFEHTQ